MCCKLSVISIYEKLFIISLERHCWILQFLNGMKNLTFSNKISSDVLMYSEDEYQQMRSKTIKSKARMNQILDNIDTLRKQLRSIQCQTKIETEAISNECAMLQKKKDKKQELTNKLGDNLNISDTSIQTPMNMYKDLKSSMDGFNSNRSALLKVLEEMESRIHDTEQESKTLSHAVTTAIATSKKELGKIDENSRVLTNTLQTQLRVIETKKRSLQSSLEQKRGETKELTKICEDLISQQSDKK